jgi:hypothetical protein
MTRPVHPYQNGLDRFTGVLWLPNAAGTGAGIGPQWTADGGTIALATPSVGIVSQLRRTTFFNSAANQAQGPRLNVAAERGFYRTTGGSGGGWYMSTIFTIEAWAANNARLFVGMADSTAGQCVNADMAGQAGEMIGLYHDTADGANVLSILTKGFSGVAKTAFETQVATLAAGQGFQWEMWNFPGQLLTFCRLTSLNTGSRVCYQATSEGPNSNTMLQPAVQMNPAGNASANGFGIGVANILVAQK